MKKIFIILIGIVMLLPVFSVFATDNADSGDGDVNNALEGRGFYLGSEYLYKVSIYVGLNDDATMHDDLSEFRMIGNNPVFVVPSTFTISNGVITSAGNKMDYQNNEILTSIDFSSVAQIVGDVPPIPITNGGNINSVKSYFGDTRTLIGLIDTFADQKNTTSEGLVENIEFTIDDVTDYYSADEILPVKVDGQYQNKVAWLVVYEPVIITYLKPDSSGYRKPVAFTATEYALTQKLGYFDWFWSSGQSVSGMTHSDLPNSIILEESWVGIPRTAPIEDGVYWSEDRIISGGGIGMRMLEANGIDVEENDTTYDYTYRVNTDVITSMKIKAFSGNITPDTRHTEVDTRENDYTNPDDGKAYVEITANGQSTTVPIVMPGGSSEYAWLKWKTPTEPCDVTVTVTITGNSSARLEDGSRSATFTVKVEDLDKNPPPDPRPHDTMIDFEIPGLPNQTDKQTAEWGVYSAVWDSDYVWHEDWKRYHDGCHGEYETDEEGNRQRTGTCHHYRWDDEGWWIDYGEWKYTYTQYTASVNTDIELLPDIHNPTAENNYDEYMMKSGYGVDINVSAGITTNAPSSHYTVAQNIVTYFPEFNYESYWRLLEKTGSTSFEFKENIYSTFNSRTHFTPLPYPDGNYEVYANVIDTWTPDGMLRVNLSDNVNIDGSVMDDWHVAPDFID